jgi:trigger factor
LNITLNSEKTEDGKISVEVTIGATDVNAAVKQAYRDIAHRYNFQGFRRGRAPRPVIDGLVGREAVLGQATEDLINEIQPKMIEELDLVPVERPDWGEADPVAEGEDYTVTCVVTVPPTAELTSYDAPAINMPPEEATEAEIDQQIEQLMSYRTTYEDDPDATEVKAGDLIQAKVVNKLNVPELEGENRTLGLANPNLPTDLVDAIIGMKVGETKDICWSREHRMEDPDPADENGNRNFEVELTVNSIQKPVTPELTDDFVKTGFGFDTVEELRDAVKEEIETDKQQSLPGLKEDRVVAALGERLDLEEIPEAYENQVFSELAEEFLGQLQRRGMSLDMYLNARQLKSEDFLADLHEQAAERARQSLALDALAAKLGIECTEEDLQREFENAQVPDVAASMAEFLSDGRMPAIRQSIRRTKAVNWLVEHADVTIHDEIAESVAAASEADAEAEPEAEADEQ